MYVYLWMIHDAVLQKLAQHFKAIVLQLKKKKKSVKSVFIAVFWVMGGGEICVLLNMNVAR